MELEGKSPLPPPGRAPSDAELEARLVRDPTLARFLRVRSLEAGADRIECIEVGKKWGEAEVKLEAISKEEAELKAEVARLKGVAAGQGRLQLPIQDLQQGPGRFSSRARGGLLVAAARGQAGPRG